MGKRQHQKDKLYITYTEWTRLYGGKKNATQSKENFKRLPFDHCCLSLLPFEKPYCDPDGNIFNFEPLIQFLKKYKINPVTGKQLDFQSLIQLNIKRNVEGQFECPVLLKSITNSSRVAAIATTGNVFYMEAIEELNIKTKNWKDLINDKPFERKDIIILQDPNNLNKFDISKFYHVRKNLRVETEVARLKQINPEILDKVSTTIQKADKFNAAHFSTGAVAASFTSTAMIPTLVNEAAIRLEADLRYERVKKKGYVRLLTNMGWLNLELFCQQVPKTCENFIKNCDNGFYDGTKFHRSIRNFMIQAGNDSTNTDKKFDDEFKSNLTHTGRGVVSMVNGSQFFITYRSCRHLDNKHMIFGKVVGGMETLNKMEQIEVDGKDRPIEDIVFIKAQVFVNPYDEADEILRKEREEGISKEKTEDGKLRIVAYKASGVGKYINPEVLKRSSKDEESEAAVVAKKKK